MTVVPIVEDDTLTGPVVVPDTLDVSSLWSPAFPSADLVRAAGALLTPYPSWDGREGPRARIVVAAGAVQVSRLDPARTERTAERAQRTARITADLAARDLTLDERLEAADSFLERASLAGDFDVAAWAGTAGDDLATWLAGRDRPAAPGRSIRAWSSKSRSNMVRTLAQVDFGPLFAVPGRIPAMVTLTYPGDWLTVAPTAKACKAHVDALKKRFHRTYGVPMVGVWKREFQRRGAPHYHILMVPPSGPGMPPFSLWLSRTWADVVSHPDPDERSRHAMAGTGIDYAEGMRARDPKRLAVYFSKHGSLGAKEYQNEAPSEWDGSPIGRFWGVWGLDKVLATVEVSEVEARAAARTMRRWQAANGFRVQRTVWRTNTRTGVMRPRKSGVWVGARMRGVAGFAVVNDGPAFLGQLSRHLDSVREDAWDTEVSAWLGSPARLRSINEGVSS